MATGIRIFFTVHAVLLAVGVTLAAPAHADAAQDQEFYEFLTEQDTDNPREQPMVVTNFSLVRSQGITACQQEDAGTTPYQAVKNLQAAGPYAFEDANNIASTAETIYCPWHGNGSEPDWTTTPTPVFPLPVYPPLAWSPQGPGRPQLDKAQ
jgi:hypothetical protein